MSDPREHVNEEPRSDLWDLIVGFGGFAGFMLVVAVIATITEYFVNS